MLCKIYDGKIARNNRKNERNQKNIIRLTETADIVTNYKFQDGLECVVRKIAKIPVNAILELNYDPVNIEAKIHEDIPLLIKIRSLVASWFPFVRDIFKDVSAESGLKYKSLCSEIRTVWINLDEDGRTQYEIFTALTEWFSETINDRKDLCEIIVAYFVQECEVFIDATAK